MGNAYYETRHGPAGYGVTDTCRADGCDTTIDRGLAYLCGDLPGGEHGCGWWFCAEHLFFPPEEVAEDLLGEGLCGACLERWERDQEEESAVEAAWIGGGDG